MWDLQTGKSREQRRGACFDKEQENVDEGVLNKSLLEESDSLGLWRRLIG